jgi:hypothetical protein
LTEVLGDEVMAAALIDRILHHCHRSISSVTAIDCASTPTCSERWPLTSSRLRRLGVSESPRRSQRHDDQINRIGCAIFQPPQMRKVRPALKGGYDRWSRLILSIGNARSQETARRWRNPPQWLVNLTIDCSLCERWLRFIQKYQGITNWHGHCYIRATQA